MEQLDSRKYGLAATLKILGRTRVMYGNRTYRSFADFERDLIRPSMRAGWSVDELEESNVDDLDFDLDPFEAALLAAESEEF